MITEEGGSRKQHLFLALSHVLRWERKIAEAQKISPESLYSWMNLLHSRGLFLILFSAKQKNNTFVLKIPTKTP